MKRSRSRKSRSSRVTRGRPFGESARTVLAADKVIPAAIARRKIRRTAQCSRKLVPRCRSPIGDWRKMSERERFRGALRGPYLLDFRCYGVSVSGEGR